MKELRLIKKMSDETFEENASSEKFQDNHESNIEYYELTHEVEGFLSLHFEGERIDFPENWGVFKDSVGSYIINISSDEILERVLNKFFKDQSSYSISKTSDGIFLIKTKKIKKAA